MSNRGQCLRGFPAIVSRWVRQGGERADDRA
jgi:hypothetical protein